MSIRRLPQRRGNIAVYLLLLVITLGLMVWLGSRHEEIGEEAAPSAAEEKATPEADATIYIDVSDR